MHLRTSMMGLAALVFLGAGTLAQGSEPGTRPGGDQARPADREAAAAKAGQDKAPADEPLVFTNEDLPRLRAEDRGTPAPPDGEAGAGEPEQDSEPADLKSTVSELEKEAIARRLAETRRRIAELELRQQHLQARLQSVQNPLLRGVTAASEEETQAVGGLSNEEQLTWVKEQIEATDRALEEARAALTELLRR